MGKYDDIIDMPHHVSDTHPQMSIWDRSAQFSPFAALTGHEAAITETARLTEEWHEPDEDKKAELDEKLRYISLNPVSELIIITYFKPDELKSGGSYEHIIGTIKKIDEINHRMTLNTTGGVTVDINTDKIVDLDTVDINTVD